MLEKQPTAMELDLIAEFEPKVDALDADALVSLAENASLGDGGAHASDLLTLALQKDPHHHAAQLLQEQLHQMFVPRWHFPMLADTERNRAYAKAIAAKVQQGDVVLDIGCGAGLTAMLAARAGAKHVYAIEQQPLIAAAARQVIADNGLSDRITVLNKWSHEIEVGVDLPEPADVVISEIVDSNLLGEGALATLRHAMASLAKPGARTVPESGTLYAQLVQSADLDRLYHPKDAEGFDLSAFHKFASVAQVTPNDSTACPLRALGPVSELFHFDFAAPSTAPDRVTRNLGCARSGEIHAVVVSFSMRLAPGIEVSNALTSDGHWGRTAYLLDQPRAAMFGSQVTVTVQHDATKLSLSIHDAPATDKAIRWQDSATKPNPLAKQTVDTSWHLPELPGPDSQDHALH